jgi:hypothetical protein
MKGPMSTLRTLTQAQLDDAMRDHEFPAEVREAAPLVVVVMTQDWCPQWTDMATYLPDFTHLATIFTVEYNRLPDFERVMRFKETVFKNWEVPYLRFYRDGVLARESNWISRVAFERMLNGQ